LQLVALELNLSGCKWPGMRDASSCQAAAGRSIVTSREVLESQLRNLLLLAR
jgi:hypothetical protein